MKKNQNKTINSSVDHDQSEEKYSNLDRIDDNLSDVIENFDLDEEQKESLLQISQEIHSGLIPSARQMKEYYDINPNIVDEIFELTKNEMKWKLKVTVK